MLRREYELAILIYDSSCSDRARNIESNMDGAYVEMTILYRKHVAKNGMIDRWIDR